MTRHDLQLEPGLVMSVQDVSRVSELNAPQIWPWMKPITRFLPKNSLANRGAYMRDFEDDEEEEDFGDEPLWGKQLMREISFDVPSGKGVGLLGPDSNVARTLLRGIAGLMPPTSGRVVVRGFVAPLMVDIFKLLDIAVERKAVFLAAKFLGWPRGVIRERWEQIAEFAAVHEIDRDSRSEMEYLDLATSRLVYSAALHIDASVYLIGKGVLRQQRDFGERCIELLARRKAEGAGIVYHAGERHDEVARLCDEVLWLERGQVAYRGTPIEVASYAARLKDGDPLHRTLGVPVTASLAGTEPVQLDPEGGEVEFELAVLRRNLEALLTVVLEDGTGDAVHIPQTEPFTAPLPGVYRATLAIPPGLLGDATFSGVLLAKEPDEPDAEPVPAVELLRFEVDASRPVAAVAEGREPGEGSGAYDRAVEWHVRRVGD